jgi:flagellar hook protein FlgE
MLQAFFNGLSGLFSFSKGLDNVSNNVSNMNTPGFRGSDTFYRSVGGQDGRGLGSSVAGTEVRTKAGDPRQTGNQTDLAISGAGYFVLRDQSNETFYTRSGQFQVDSNGFLVDSVTQKRVAGINPSGALIDINIRDQRSLPPKPTTRVEMVGTLARTGPTDTSHKISNIQVFDASGATHNLSVEFDQLPSPPNSWSVKVFDSGGAMLNSGTIAFGVDGTPQAGFNNVSFALGMQLITLEFGTPGSFNLASQVASGPSHTLGAKVVDGSAIAGLSSLAFDDKGVVKLTYSNGEKRDGSQLALADFPDETALIATENSLYRAPDSMRPNYGRPADGPYGRIQGGYLELSNVDLSQEFGDILIIQRGYQASSRVMTVSNELLEQLYNGTRGG